MEEPAFWLVWNETNGAPVHKHKSFLSAKAEAERLASRIGGQKFHVLQLVGSCVKQDVAWIGVEPLKDTDIPF